MFITDVVKHMLIGGKIGDRKPLTEKQLENRASRRRMASADRKKNRTTKAEKRKRAKRNK